MYERNDVWDVSSGGVRQKGCDETQICNKIMHELLMTNSNQ